jgi:hypothetical protein
MNNNNQHFEYQVVLLQQNRVAVVNGNWQGGASEEDGGAIESCPPVWDYLNEVGAWGWELVASISQDGTRSNSQVLYLKRGR